MWAILYVFSSRPVRLKVGNVDVCLITPTSFINTKIDESPTLSTKSIFTISKTLSDIHISVGSLVEMVPPAGLLSKDPAYKLL